MKTKIIMLSLTMLSFGNLYSQNVSDSLFVDFLNKTFSDYFAKMKTWHPLENDFYIRNGSSLPEGVNTDYENFKLHLLDKYQEYPLIKKGKMSELYTPSAEHISKDTIDIVISIHSVRFKKCFRIEKIEGKRKLITGNYFFGLQCGGDMGYIPEGRFIYDIETNEWKYITERELRDERLEEIKNMFKKKTD